MEHIVSSAWIAMYVVIAISIVIGNGLILLSIVQFKRLRSNMYLFIGNLAVSDLLVGLILIPYYLLVDGAEMDSGQGILPKSKYLCLGKVAAFVICLGSSCMCMLHISIERFVSLAYPLKTKIYFTKRKVVAVILVGWIIVVANGTVHFYLFNTYGENNTSCVSDEFLSSTYKLLINWCFVFVLSVNVIMYALAIRITFKVARRTPNIECGLMVHAKTKKDLYQLITMTIVFGTFLICWLPYMCAAMITTFKETPLTQRFRRYSLVSGLLNSSVNWIIYGYRNQIFRSSFKSLLLCRSAGGELRRSYITSELNTISLDEHRTSINSGIT